MKNKEDLLYGDMPDMEHKKIYLNVNSLKKGSYELHLVNENVVLKRIVFKKK